MTVQLLEYINHYLGLAADSKPTGSGVLRGSTFEETDTADIYKFDGTSWFIHIAGVGVISDRNHDIDGRNALITASAIYARIDDDTVKIARLDASTEAQMIVDYEHHEIHSGSHFIMNDAFDLSINNVLDIRITTPNTTKWPHALLEFDTETEYEYWLYETVTIDTVGTAFTPINSNRNSATASTVAIDVITNTSLANANADTGVGGATVIWHGFAGSGREGGGGGGRNELILKQNTIYGFRAEAKAAGWIHGELHWYEHTDSN